MKSLAQQIEQILARMNELSAQEQTLVSSLNDALKQADQHLLDEIRTVSLEHDSRRGAILGEIQLLAGKVGMLPSPVDPQTAYASLKNSFTYQAIDDAIDIEQDPSDTPPGADWREAVSNMIEDYGLVPGKQPPH